MNIKLGSLVSGITQEACYHLSGVIQNGLLFIGNPHSEITIKRGEIDFGITLQSEFHLMNGSFMPNWYCEKGRIKYKFGSTIGCSLSGKISYKGAFAPNSPDNEVIYKELFSKFGI